jgi:hypothetical protein
MGLHYILRNLRNFAFFGRQPALLLAPQIKMDCGSGTECPTDYAEEDEDNDGKPLSLSWKDGLTHGSQVTVLDCREKWCRAKIMKKRPNVVGDEEFKVHFFGWNARWDEWVIYSSCRIRPWPSQLVPQHSRPPHYQLHPPPHHPPYQHFHPHRHPSQIEAANSLADLSMLTSPNPTPSTSDISL